MQSIRPQIQLSQGHQSYVGGATQQLCCTPQSCKGRLPTALELQVWQCLQQCRAPNQQAGVQVARVRELLQNSLLQL